MTKTTVSNVVLLVRVDDPIRQVTRSTLSTIVPVEHFPGEAPDTIAEMALEIGPPVSEWSRY